MKNRELMSKGNPFKAVLVFSIPSIIAMLVNSIYNIVDKIFIGKYVNSDALAGLQVVHPLMLIWFAFCVVAGLGGSSYASNKLGEKKDAEANHVFNNSIFITLVMSILGMALFYIFFEQLLKLGGVLESNYIYARDYFSIIILGFVFQALAYLLMMFIRAEGRPVIAMSSQLTGFFVNIFFDWLFIVILDMGALGAALGTVIGHMSSSLVCLTFYLFTKSHYFKIKFKEIRPKKEYVLQILSIGASSFILNICTALSVFIYNNILKKYSNGLAILGILSSLGTLAFMPNVGIRQGLLPLFSYNYGEKNYKRLFSIYGAGTVFGIGYGLVMCAIMMSFPSFFINLFVKEGEANVISEAIRISSYYYIGIIFICLNMNTSALYQSTRENVKASILSSFRQCVFLIPALFILDAIFKETGVWMASPISDVLSALTSLVFFLSTYFTFKKTGYISKRDYRLALDIIKE